MRRLAWVFSVFAALSLPASALAAPQWCNSKISYTWVDRLGNVYVNPDFRQDNVQICNINEAWKGVSVEACRSWQALAMSATLADKAVIIYYDDLASCVTLPTYGASPSPGYIMLFK